MHHKLDICCVSLDVYQTIMDKISCMSFVTIKSNSKCLLGRRGNITECVWSILYIIKHIVYFCTDIYIESIQSIWKKQSYTYAVVI